MEDVILYGAGSDINKIIPLLDNAGYHPLCITDRDENKIGGNVQGIPIVSPEVIKRFDTKTIIITASFFDDIYNRIESIIDRKKYKILVAPYAWLMLVNVEYDKKLLREAANYINTYKKDILGIYDIKDAKTKNILDFLLKARLDNKYYFRKYDRMKGMQYIEGYFYEKELDNIGQFTFIDVGAYVGDTYEMMADMYDSMCKYYAYEPSKDNYDILSDKLLNKKNNCQVVCRNIALGERNGTIEMGKSGGEFGIVDNKTKECEQVPVRKLDEESISICGRLVIKMDVEGAELDVLRGGIKTIQKYKPIMAICVYHRYQDIYELPHFLIENSLKYRFILKSGIHTHMLAIPEM